MFENMTMGTRKCQDRVSNLTKINLRIVIDGHIDFLLRFSRASVVGGRMVVGNDLHRLFHLFVTFILEAFAIAIFTCVDSTTEIVILWRGRRGPDTISSQIESQERRSLTCRHPQAQRH